MFIYVKTNSLADSINLNWVFSTKYETIQLIYTSVYETERISFSLYA